MYSSTSTGFPTSATSPRARRRRRRLSDPLPGDLIADTRRFVSKNRRWGPAAATERRPSVACQDRIPGPVDAVRLFLDLPDDAIDGDVAEFLPQTPGDVLRFEPLEP